ncbi:dihydroorotate dehydrogenase [Ceratobasidium sp. 414]|nr:dihydroorotate dehydrogenase [Ceratobasidium sp. 414]
MPVSIRGLTFDTPVLNSSCPWASDLDDLTALYASPFTGGITTRTSTLKGFPDDPKVHQVAFASNGITTLNSYGYSPYPLRQYLEWVREIISNNPESRKPIIISITFDSPGPEGNESETSLDMLLEMIQTARRQVSDIPSDGTEHAVRIAVEINTSCPNIMNKPPPSYEPASMLPLLSVVAGHTAKDPSLVIGLKLPPYVHAKQFTDVVAVLSQLPSNRGLHPIAFLTCTNTLGSSLLFEDQVAPSQFEKASSSTEFAVPTIYGGLAGESIHPLSLGNVHRFVSLLKSSPDPAIQDIAVIGVGGVTNAQAARRMEEMKLLILGLDNAGKTTMLYKITMGEAVDTAPTVGSNTEVFEYKNLKFVLWDIGGQSSLRQSWSQYFTAARAVILVVDSCDAGRLSLAKEELHKMCADESLKGALLLVFANKQDVRGCLTAARISEELRLTDLRDHGMLRVDRSRVSSVVESRQNANIQTSLFEGLDWLASRLEKR